MSRKYLHAAKCSQMSSPKTGTGQGNDLCTEAVGAMIDATYKLGPKAKAARTPEDVEVIMHDLCAWIPNNGGNRNVSHLENFGIWFPDWLRTYHYDHLLSLNNVHNPRFLTIQEVINNGHIAVGGFNDYRQLRLANGGNPFAWNPAHEPPAGHVLLIVGYDDNYSGGQPSVIVHDPLRGYDGQPVDYSFASFEKAGFADCTQIVSAAGVPALSYAFNSETQPAPTQDPQAELAAWQDFGKAIDPLVAALANLKHP